jgi:glycosyltransferase involved in cell wall biosynthesis
MKNKDTKIAVVIPYYNAQKHIAIVVKNLPDCIHTIIIVDDKSPDALPKEVILASKKEHVSIVFLENKINLGVGGATKNGFEYAMENDIDVVIKLDADNQMDATYIPIMLDYLVAKNIHVVKGNRFRDTKALKKMPFIRRFGNLGLSFLTKIATGYWNSFDPTNGYIAIKTSVLKELDFSKLSNRYFFETSLLAELYFCRAKIKEVPMPAIYDEEKSSMQVWKMPFIFSRKLLGLFLKRLAKAYFLYDFNIGSIYLIFGNLLFFFGFIFGLYNWIYYARLDVITPTGTIMIATVSLILGFQLLLQFMQYDILNAPKCPDHDE